MLSEKEFKIILKDIVQRILLDTISNYEVHEIVQHKLEANDIWECSNLLITDCYYTLKHIEEEKILRKEWEYFMECFNDSRKYNLEEKLQILS